MDRWYMKTIGAVWLDSIILDNVPASVEISEICPTITLPLNS